MCSTKICIRCNTEKDVELFMKAQNTCKDCRRIIAKKYYDDNKVAISERSKKYYKNNSDTIKEHQSRYYQENKDKISSKAIVSYIGNKEKYQKRSKEYREKNKDKIRKRDIEYKKVYCSSEEFKEKMKRYRENLKERDIDSYTLKHRKYRIKRVNELPDAYIKTILKNTEHLDIENPTAELNSRV
jgi:hypothetical protein